MISVQILDYVYSGGSLDFNKSIIGELDVGDSADFPLALSFSIADVRSLDARTGTYSKTFKIPATKNNNKILRYAYYEESFIDGNQFPNEKDCRILVDNNYSVTGKIQLTAVGKSDAPSYYSCVFYGSNVDWASSLSTKLLKDLSVRGGADGSGWDNLNKKGAATGVDLKVQHQDIVDTWDAVDAENTQPSGGAVSANTSPIVYPVISYGENNAGGADATIQLLKNQYEQNGGSSTRKGYYGWYNAAGSYNTPVPSCDWRPCIFIYDIIKQIFSQEGYTIVSDFIDDDMFKKLIMALPNFKHNNVIERVNANSWTGEFNDGAVGSGLACSFLIDGSTEVPPFNGHLGTSGWQTVFQDILWDGGGQLVETVTDPPTEIVYDNATGTFTINEFGFYDISVENLSVWIESVCYLPLVNEATSIFLKTIRFGCYVQTVGQTSWNKIGDLAYLFGEDDDYTKWSSCTDIPSGRTSTNFNSNQQEDMLIENQYLNKGDKIKFQLLLRAQQSTGSGKTMGFETYIYGGNDSTAAPADSGESNRGGVVKITHKGENVEYGQTYDLKNVIDSSSTQIGFLKGVSHAFNLQFLTDTVAKTVEIEPFNTFYKNQNQALDWTNKVDFSQIQEDKWIETELLREVIFKYKTDSEDKVVEDRGIKYWDSILDEYPYREILSNEFSAGQVVFENPFFAGTTNKRNKESTQGWVANAPYGAVLWGLCDGYNAGDIPTGGSGCRPDKGYNFVPRLLNWERLQCSSFVSTALMLYARIQIWSSAIETIWSAPVGGADFQLYPQATSYNRFDSSVPVLTYNTIRIIEDRNCITGALTSADPQKGLYQTYYQKQIEMMKKTPRLKTIYINLTLSDASNLDLRKLVYVDGSYYRINRIIDFQPNNNKTTKVELVLWEELGNFEAIAATF